MLRGMGMHDENGALQYGGRTVYNTRTLGR